MPACFVGSSNLQSYKFGITYFGLSHSSYRMQSLGYRHRGEFPAIDLSVLCCTVLASSPAGCIFCFFPLFFLLSILSALKQQSSFSFHFVHSQASIIFTLSNIHPKPEVPAQSICPAVAIAAVSVSHPGVLAKLTLSLAQTFMATAVVQDRHERLKRPAKRFKRRVYHFVRENIPSRN